MALEHVPDGYHSVTPSLTVRGANDALAFYGKAFGAIERFRMPDENTGKIFHAEFQIGDSVMMLSDEFEGWGNAPEIGEGAAYMIYVPDCDAVFAQAVEAGATVLNEPKDEFWGDRVGRVADPFGYRWAVAQKVRDVTPEEIAEGAKSWLS